MRIMGIDPGLAKIGWGIIDVLEDNSISLVEYGCISTTQKKTFTQRLGQIYKEILDLVKKYEPEHVAVEELFFASNAKSAIHVAHARGVILLALNHISVQVIEYTPLQIKQAVVGFGHAKKEQVQYMVKNFLHLTETPRPDHASDALAAAICHNNSYKINDLYSKAK